MDLQNQSVEQTQNDLKKKWYKKWWAIVIFAVVVIVVLVESSDETKKDLHPNITQEETLHYELISKNAGGTVLTLRVYTTEKEDSKLIRLTDKLLSENQNLTHLFIDYFDDKEIAGNYFDRVLDERISDDVKDDMFKHYVANFKMNTSTGLKALYKNQNGEWVELKKY